MTPKSRHLGPFPTAIYISVYSLARGGNLKGRVYNTVFCNTVSFILNPHLLLEVRGHTFTWFVVYG